MSEPNSIRINDVDYVRKDSIPPQVSYDQAVGPWQVGQKYYIETVTKYYHGTLIDVTKDELVIVGGAWIADTGRFWNFITGKSKPNEVEPLTPDNPGIIGRGALVFATKLNATFGEQK